MADLNGRLVNLIPIPALDGGYLLFVIEAVIGKPLPEAFQAVLCGGIALLLALMVCVTVYDMCANFPNRKQNRIWAGVHYTICSQSDYNGARLVR